MLLNRDITQAEHRKNFLLLFGQSFFFLLTINILDKDTVLPGMLSRMGANETLIGLLSVITIGLPKFSQIFFGRLLQAKSTRKKYVLQGFAMRILSLAAITYVLWLYYLWKISAAEAIVWIFVFYTVYSLFAAYTTVGIVDLVPRALFSTSLKRFYSLKQVGNSFGLFLALLLIRPVLKSYPFPLNYAIVHLLGTLSLLVSTLFIVKVTEKIIASRVKMRLGQYLKFIVKELKDNPALLFFALIVNSEGFFLSIVPFFTTFAISNFSINAQLIGTLFAWKIIGLLTSSAVLFFARDYDYYKILAVNIIISFSVPLMLLVFGSHLWIYKVAFFLVGSFNSIYRITYEGILVEISNDKNRAAYASVLGSSNISTFIIPLVSGALIRSAGYGFTFVLSAVLLGFAVYFLVKLKPYLAR